VFFEFSYDLPRVTGLLSMATKESVEGVAPGHRRVNRSSGFVEEVFEIIRSDLMSLRIPPDTRISIDNLARELGVSQTPIREH
jgi:Bacterial regulatory proteins, gntR family